MEQMEFNLLDEPWIRVMTEDCTVVERSLMQVLLNSHQYQRLAGELPTQDVALFALAAGNFADGLLPRRSGG